MSTISEMTAFYLVRGFTPVSIDEIAKASAEIVQNSLAV